MAAAGIGTLVFETSKFSIRIGLIERFLVRLTANDILQIRGMYLEPAKI